MEVKDILINEFVDEMEKVREMEVGSEQHKIALDGVTKLADRLIEIEKFETELEENKTKREEEKHDRKIRYCTDLGKTGGRVIMLTLAFIATTNFERFGTFTTKAGQSVVKELLNLKIRP